MHRYRQFGNCSGAMLYNDLYFLNTLTARLEAAKIEQFLCHMLGGSRANEADWMFQLLALF
jgi:hypothetical protein